MSEFSDNEDMSYAYDDDFGYGDDDSSSDGDMLDDANDYLGSSHFSEKLETPPRRAYQVDFVVYSAQDLEMKQKKEIDHVCSVLKIPATHAASLLRSYHWKKDRLMEEFMDDIRGVEKKAGVILDANRYAQARAECVPMNIL